MSDNPTKITSFGFRPSFTLEHFNEMYRQWPGRYTPREAHANVSSIFTEEELESLYNLVGPFVRAGLLKLGKPPGTQIFKESPDRKSVFAVFRPDQPSEALFEIEKEFVEAEDDDDKRFMSTYYSFKGGWNAQDLTNVSAFKKIETRVRNTLDETLPRIRRRMALVKEHS